jgi:hypothetical protein
MAKKNPYEQESPEWQLFELAESADLQAVAFAQDAERYQAKAKQQREKAERFREVLAKLEH